MAHDWIIEASPVLAQRVGNTGYGSSNTSAYSALAQLNSSAAKLDAATNVFHYYAQESDACGRAVLFNPQIGCLPYMLGDDNNPVFLHKFVEVIDEYIDHAVLKAEFPNLSYGQIAGAISFLRKLAQFNINGIDIDDLEDAEREASPEFQAMIEQSLAEQEQPLVHPVK